MTKGFYLFLLLVSLLHGSLLLLKLQKDAKKGPAQVLNVRLLEDEASKKRQIVQSEDSEKNVPKDDAFLSDKDRSFDRQSKARKVDTFKQSAQGGGSPRKKKVDLKLSDLGMSGKHPLEEAAKEYKDKKNGKQSGDPNTQAQVSSTNDHIEDVPPGDLTHLNTAEYKYYGYYHRIRQKLEQYWGRSIQEKAESIQKEGRRLPASDEMVTALRITLNSQGRVIGINVISASGIKELDDAAIESFNQAGPFPNPPKGLVVNGRVVIEWGFVVNT